MGRDGDNEDFDFSKDEENLKKSSKSTGPSSSSIISPTMTKEQIEDLQRVQRERIEADRLRKLGYDVSKKNLGIRYQDTLK